MKFPFELEVVCFDFIGKNDIASAGIERETWSQIVHNIVICPRGHSKLSLPG